MISNMHFCCINNEVIHSDRHSLLIITDQWKLHIISDRFLCCFRGWCPIKQVMLRCTDHIIMNYNIVIMAVWETTARQLARCECKMILASISIQVLAILASWHVWANYDNLLLASWCNKINSPKSIEWIDWTWFTCVFR